MYARLYRPKGSERIALVRVTLASQGGMLVLVARGATRKALTNVKQYGPMPLAQAKTAFAGEVQKLRAEGFGRGGLGALLLQLESKKRKRRALAARRLGFLGEPGAVDGLLQLAAKANEELCVVLDALGRLGDARAVPAARSAAERKLLSRRRSGVEALRRLGDKDGVSAARERALARLPHAVAVALAGVELDPKALEAAVVAVAKKDRGLALDTLYEMDLPGATRVVRGLLLSEPIFEPHLFRYAKSIWKRAMLRDDFETFALLSTRIERLGRTQHGTKAKLKSGFDGEPKTMCVFSPSTVSYLRRATWRHLRTLATYRPEAYAFAAAQILGYTTHDDETKPKGLFGTYADCYTFSKVLFGGGGRYVLKGGTLRHKLKKAGPAVVSGAREEAHPMLWDISPLAHVKALGHAVLPIVHEWALAAVQARHPGILQEAPPEDVVALLAAPFVKTVELGAAELRRRFDLSHPDWALVAVVVRDTRPMVQALALEWLRRTAPLWTMDPSRVTLFLIAPEPAIRSAVADHVVAAAASAPAPARAAMAKAMLEVLRAKEPAEGAHDPPASIARALGPEVAGLLSIHEILEGIAAGSPAFQGVCAAAFAHKPGAEARYGLLELSELCSHENTYVRAAARALLGRRVVELAVDPSPLFALLESEWPDARGFAVEVLRGFEPAAFGVEAILALLDSSRAEAQDLGKGLVQARLGELSTRELLKRLAQHPDRRMRRYALDMVVTHLGEGFVPLASTEELFRAILFDLTPERAVKARAFRFLGERGTRDAAQAEICAKLLSDVVRSKTLRDFEPAIAALCRICLAFPEVESAIKLGPSTLEGA